jgi:hypothetical protein
LSLEREREKGSVEGLVVANPPKREAPDPSEEEPRAAYRKPVSLQTVPIRLGSG